MIIVNEVSKSYGSRTLFDNVSVKFSPGNRYGLTGPNGAGKSTFMKILTGEYEPSNAGTISRPRKVGVLKQDQFAYDNERIIDTVVMGNSILWSAFKERDHLCELPELTEEQMNRLGELEVIIADENGYSAEMEAAEILRGIGINDEDHENLMSTLATDYKFRVLLAQALFGEPEALLLDEPTNHLDIPAKETLEAALKKFDGTVVVVSHDRYFIQEVANKIVEIKDGQLVLYHGNYHYYLERKEKERLKEEEKRLAAEKAEKDAQKRAQRLAKEKGRKA